MSTNYNNYQDFEHALRYKCGCLLFLLSELVCYSRGVHFSSSKEALIKATLILDNNNIFDEALSLKQGRKSMNLPFFVARLDELIDISVNNMNKNQLANLKKIVLKKCDLLYEQSNHINQWKKILNNLGIENTSVVVKDSLVDCNGVLNIHAVKLNS